MDVAQVAIELEHERDRLIGERERLEGALGPDDATEETLVHVVRQIEVALARIAQGTYGTCARCGSEIADERLEALPYATWCVRCAERVA